MFPDMSPHPPGSFVVKSSREQKLARRLNEKSFRHGMFIGNNRQNLPDADESVSANVSK